MLERFGYYVLFFKPLFILLVSPSSPASFLAHEESVYLLPNLWRAPLLLNRNVDAGGLLVYDFLCFLPKGAFSMRLSTSPSLTSPDVMQVIKWMCYCACVKLPFDMDTTWKLRVEDQVGAPMQRPRGSSDLGDLV